MSQAHDYDYLIVGSGFGGSVSALRLAEKGYRVAVLESGRRFEDHDFAERLSQLRRMIFAPKLGLKGILRVTPFKDVMILSGSGVGGGSLVYAQTLWRAGDGFFEDWRTVCGDAPDLEKYYELAEGMLGVVAQPRRTPADEAIEAISVELGVADTFRPVPVGVYFGEPGVIHADPYFGGAGPARSGCIECGLCLLGCRNNAKNTLPKNYLWFAERLGVQIDPERTVTSIRPLGAADGSDGYAVTSERTGSWIRKDRRTQTARGVVVAAGALGTNQLLAQCKSDGALPRISDRLGQLVRTNSEAMTAVTTPDDRGWGRSVSITSSMHPTGDSHVEAVTYGPGGNVMGLMFTLLTGDGTRITRPLKLLAQICRHPIRFVRVTNPRGWSQRSLITGVMQSTDTSLSLVPKRRILRPAAAAHHPPGSGPPDAHLPAGGQRLRPAARRPDRWDSAELADRSVVQHANHCTHTGRCGRGRHPRARSCRWRTSGVRLPEPPCLRWCGHPGQSRCESEPDDHGDGRAGDGSNPGQAGYPDDNPPREVDPPESVAV